MPIEKIPRNPVPRDLVIPGSTSYKVTNGDTWESVARAHDLEAKEIIDANFKTRDPAEVNWYLRHYVGCDRSTGDGKNWIFSSSASPGLIRIPPRRRIRLSVPMREQGQNPICWIASVAMISSYKGRASVGIGNFTGGYDPSNASVANPVTSWGDQYKRLRDFGFVVENPFPNRSPDAAYIEEILRKHGPWMLMHFASDLLPGHFSPGATHAIVITGIDTSTDQVWFNNPWGTVDEVTTVNSILLAMENLFSRGINSVAYMP